MGDAKKTNDTIVTSFREKVMYGIGDAGGALLLSFPGAYLTLYCTDSLGLGAAFLGTMMLICRLLDGVSDVIMGMIVERTRTKWGKARPWFVVSILPLVISFIALFNVPKSLSTSGQMTYIYIWYFLMTVAFYTVNNIGYHAMLQRFSFTPEDRGSVSAARAFLCILFSALTNILIPIAIPMLGGESAQHTWTVLAAAVGIISLICLGLTAVGIKEKIPCDAGEISAEEKARNAANNKLAMGFLLKNKYFYILILLSLVWFASFNMMGITYYYARDIIGNGTLTSVLIMAGMLPSLLSMPVVPGLFKKFGMRAVVTVGLAIGAAASLCICLNPHNLVWNIVFLVIKCLAISPLMAGVATLAGDVTDFAEQNIGVRTEGLTTSAYSVGVKVGTGLGGALVAWGLAIGGYNYMLEVQSQATQNAIIFTFAVIPAILFAIGAVLMFFWKIEKETEELKAKKTAEVK